MGSGLMTADAFEHDVETWLLGKIASRRRGDIEVAEVGPASAGSKSHAVAQGDCWGSLD